LFFIVFYCFLLVVCVLLIFQFTWSLRQYGVGGVLIGVAPDGRGLSEIDLMLYANRAGKVIDQAAHSFNSVLRSIYFSLATLAWFIDDHCLCSLQCKYCLE
jgi:uncharacterized membrane protein